MSFHRRCPTAAVRLTLPGRAVSRRRFTGFVSGTATGDSIRFSLLELPAWTWLWFCCMAFAALGAGFTLPDRTGFAVTCLHAFLRWLLGSPCRQPPILAGVVFLALAGFRAFAAHLVLLLPRFFRP